MMRFYRVLWSLAWAVFWLGYALATCALAGAIVVAFAVAIEHLPVPTISEAFQAGATLLTVAAMIVGMVVWWANELRKGYDG